MIDHHVPHEFCYRGYHLYDGQVIFGQFVLGPPGAGKSSWLVGFSWIFKAGDQVEIFTKVGQIGKKHRKIPLEFDAQMVFFYS